MKNLLQIKNFKHRLGWLAAFVSLLFMSQGALATTYYVYYADNNNNPTEMTKQGSTSDNTYTLTGTFAASHNYYVMFATNSDNKPSNTEAWYQSHIKCNSTSPGTNVSLTAVQEYNLTPSNTTYTWATCRFQLSQQCSSVTITLSSVSGSNPATGKYTVSAGSTATAPQVLWGEQASISASKDVLASAYVKAQGCDGTDQQNVTKLRVYYAKNTTPDDESDYVELTDGNPFLINNAYTITISADLLESYTESTDKIHMKVAGYNEEGGWSELSDEAILSYMSCEGTITTVSIQPQGGELLTGQIVTFDYTANASASITSQAWTINGAGYDTKQVELTVPASGFTAALTLTGACNTLSAETQTFTVCNAPLGDITLTGCPDGPVALNTTIDFSADADNSAAANYTWYVDAESRQVGGKSYSVTPNTVTSKKIEVWVTGCPGITKKAACTVEAKNGFTSQNGSATMNQCSGGNVYDVVGDGTNAMFDVTPESITITQESVLSTDFTYANGKLTWDVSGKTQGTYTYTLVAHKTDYLDSDPVTLTITYNTSAPAGTIQITTPAEDGTETTPWTAVALAASISGSDIDHIDWSVSPTSLVEATNATGTEAYFKGKVPTSSSKTYTITATPKSVNCTSGTPVTRTIVVKRDVEECD